MVCPGPPARHGVPTRSDTRTARGVLSVAKARNAKITTERAER